MSYHPLISIAIPVYKAINLFSEITKRKAQVAPLAITYSNVIPSIDSSPLFSTKKAAGGCKKAQNLHTYITNTLFLSLQLIQSILVLFSLFFTQIFISSNAMCRT